jgi:DNA-binding transcriptional MerR regulator
MAHEHPEVPKVNIKAAARETGLTPDTIRAWERRYGLPVPDRTQGGHRIYSPRDIATLKWLKVRQDEGLNISRAVSLWRSLESEGQDPLAAPQYAKPTQYGVPSQAVTIDSLRDSWVKACMNFDPQTANQILNQAFALHPVEFVCLELLIKGLATIGQDWYRGQIIVQQEHFASEMVIRRLESLLSASPQPTLTEHILVLCPPEEQHAVSALLITLFLRRIGRDALFLGANVPLERLGQTIKNTKPRLAIVVSQQLFTAATSLQVAQLLNEYGIPIAFGGRIYNMIPDLRDRIPGIFLGETLERVPSMVSQLLEYTPPTPLIEPPSQKYLLTLEKFCERQLWVEARALQQMTSAGINPRYLEIANANLARNIIATLTLGDISFLGNDIDWVKGLIQHQGIPTQIFTDYIRSYAEAIADELDDRGSLIADYLFQLVEEER